MLPKFLLTICFQNRLPKDYEILDGLSPTFDERLPVFLERVKQFPSCIFTIILPEGIKQEHLAAIRSFLSGKVTSSANIRLHCVQRELSLPQASPFFEHRFWDNNKLRSRPTENSVWRQSATGANAPIEEATVVVSVSCCAGKTRYIRDEMQRLSLSEPGPSDIATLAVHEKSNGDNLTMSISTKLLLETPTKILHISVLSIPSSGIERAVWLREMNRFFFEFFILRVLHDSRSHTSSFIGRSRWCLFVELPSWEVTPEGCNDWLRSNIPVLALVSRLRIPSELFHVSEEARRVCTYLRAIEDGSINDQYEPGGAKQIVFVLDQSGSMEYEVVQNRSQLSVATDYALQVFDSHVHVDDVSLGLCFHFEYAISSY